MTTQSTRRAQQVERSATARSGLRRVLTMEVVSGLGDGIFWVGLAAILLGRGAGGVGFAMTALARFGPRALLSAPAGVLADRVDRRRLLVALDLSRAAVMAVMAFAAASTDRLEPLILAMLANYILTSPYKPALTAALPLVVGEDNLCAANAVISTTRQVMTFVGPLVGVAVLHWSSSAWSFAVNAASFVVAAALMGSIAALSGRADRSDAGLAEHRASWRREITDGLRDVSATIGLGSIAFVVFIMYIARGAEGMLYVVLARDRLGLGNGGVGVLSGAIGFGALLVLPAAGRLADLPSPSAAILAAMGTTAVPIAALVVVRSAVAACIGLAVLGFGVVVFEVLSIVVLQRLAPADALGRIYGLIGTASSAGKLLGALVAPGLVGAFGVRWGLAVLAAMVGVVTMVSAPSLQRAGAASQARRDRLRPIVSVLAKLDLFAGGSTATLERIADTLLPERVGPGDVVIRQGDPADDLFVVIEGDFTVLDGEAQINAMAPGDWFGEIGLLQRRPRTASVVAATPALVWRIPGDAFLATMAVASSEPSAAFEIMADRLARTSRADAPAAAAG